MEMEVGMGMGTGGDADADADGEGRGSGAGEVQRLMQLRAMYEMTTAIASRCFETCLPRLNPRLEDSERNCVSNCAANFLHMKVLFTRRLIEAAQAAQLADER